MSKKKLKPLSPKKDNIKEAANPIFNPEIIKASFKIRSLGDSMDSSLTSNLSKLSLSKIKKGILLRDKIIDVKKEK